MSGYKPLQIAAWKGGYNNCRKVVCAGGDVLAFSVFFRCVVAMNRCFFPFSTDKI